MGRSVDGGATRWLEVVGSLEDVVAYTIKLVGFAEPTKDFTLQIQFSSTTFLDGLGSLGYMAPCPDMSKLCRSSTLRSHASGMFVPIQSLSFFIRLF